MWEFVWVQACVHARVTVMSEIFNFSLTPISWLLSRHSRVLVMRTITLPRSFNLIKQAVFLQMSKLPICKHVMICVLRLTHVARLSSQLLIESVTRNPCEFDLTSLAQSVKH